MKRFISHAFIICLLLHNAFAQNWTPDLGNGKYKNPILFADYSDPDAIRVNDDYYLVASSFGCMPGIPILHSRDLVNWRIIGHVYQRLPFEKFDKPAHGLGCWAPALRYHQGTFYVYFCTPQEGLFLARAQDPAGKWELQHLVAVELWEDPCPFWDDDGNAYLARSKLHAGVLYLHRMSADGTKILDDGTIIYQNETEQPTIEGPKFLKRDGYYYISAPAGGVSKGWQTILRSRNIYGPYEAKKVLQQGGTEINGPHQGAIVDTQSGEWWFLHFQSRDAYGRITHLQPAAWNDGWLVMGNDPDHDGIGEPVLEWAKPKTSAPVPITAPQTSDEFATDSLALQWQWHANWRDEWYSLTDQPGKLRLNAVRNVTQHGNLWFVPNLLMQKFPAPEFSVTTKIDFHPGQPGQKSGLVIMGKQWASLALLQTTGSLQLVMQTGTDNRNEDQTQLIESISADSNSCHLKVIIDAQARCNFFYSFDGDYFKPIGSKFTAMPGIWIGAKIGLFCIDPSINSGNGYAVFDWFRFD